MNFKSSPIFVNAHAWCSFGLAIGTCCADNLCVLNGAFSGISRRFQRVDRGEGFGEEGNAAVVWRWRRNDKVGSTKRGRRKLSRTKNGNVETRHPEASLPSDVTS
ncbi:hypothetical protein JHK86_043521 [Glycine max]|nr:hypothetical protein JHK86_043521 [Glycine max]